jgi:DtxR family transcriptional regulator, Mn-dependent transcriptional regulator
MTRVQSDEWLEQLWYRVESGKAGETVAELASRFEGDLDVAVLEQLRDKQFIELDGAARVLLTEQGKEHARRLVRQHRLAERLLHDVLGMQTDDSETDACEFEHVVAPGLVDSICILLGHPQQCPHGKPIPRGECCERNLRLVESAPRALTRLRVGDQGRVAFVRCERDDQIHRLDSHYIRPGAALKLHQSFPAYVIECEGGHVALEEKIAARIHVWLETDNAAR